MRALAQSMGTFITSSVNRFTSAATLWDDAPGNHAGMKARMGKVLIMLAPGNNSGEPKMILLSALAMQGSSIDSTSYPYIVFIGIETDSLHNDNQKT